MGARKTDAMSLRLKSDGNLLSEDKTFRLDISFHKNSNETRDQQRRKPAMIPSRFEVNNFIPITSGRRTQILRNAKM